MIDLAQRVGAGDAEGAHEVPHVEPVGAAGLRALLLRQPDFFFGDGGELVERGELAGVGRPERARQPSHRPRGWVIVPRYAEQRRTAGTATHWLGEVNIGDLAQTARQENFL